jgi:N-acyl-D-aspartate/D-glutamate deacylase
VVAVGSAADLVLFNPVTVRDTSTHAEPKRAADGVRFVLVNGHVALDEGKMTGTRAGRTLRRRADGEVTAGGA